jgi:hypothetical protein
VWAPISLASDLRSRSTFSFFSSLRADHHPKTGCCEEQYLHEGSVYCHSRKQHIGLAFLKDFIAKVK